LDGPFRSVSVLDGFEGFQVLVSTEYIVNCAVFDFIFAFILFL
jgi:hypothetical protein